MGRERVKAGELAELLKGVDPEQELVFEISLGRSGLRWALWTVGSHHFKSNLLIEGPGDGPDHFICPLLRD